MLVFFFDFLVDTEIPHEMRFAFFLLHNLSQAELRIERKVICTK